MISGGYGGRPYGLPCMAHRPPRGRRRPSRRVAFGRGAPDAGERGDLYFQTRLKPKNNKCHGFPVSIDIQ